MEIRDPNLLKALLNAEFDRAKRYKLYLSCILLHTCNLKEISKKQGSVFL